MKVSVIVPSYRPKEYIWKCLDSLREQTMQKNEFEVILVLNGCKEPYEKTILKYCALHSDFNLVYLQTDYGNSSNARNMGLDICKGEYIAFVDDDDYVSPVYLEELYNAATYNTVSLSNVCNFYDSEPNATFPDTISRTYKYCISHKVTKLNSKARHYFSGPVMKLIHRSIIEGKRFNEQFLKSQDSVYMFLISNKIKNISFTSENAIYYRRIRENSAVTKKRTFKWLLRHTWMLTKEYARIYWNGSGYSLIFFLTRNMGIIKSFFVVLNNNVIGKYFHYQKGSN